MALATLAFSCSMFGLAVATTVLTAGIAALAVSACVAAGLVSSYGFFKAYNILSAKNIAGDQKPQSRNEASPVDQASTIFI